jgi:hypothetical protein
VLASEQEPQPAPPPLIQNCTANPYAPCYGWDRGGDLLGTCVSNYKGTVSQCEALCTANASCMAWTWCGPGSSGPGPRCCLHKDVPGKVAPFAHMACGIAKRAVGLAVGESVIKCPSPLPVLKDTNDHSCY